MPLAKAYALTLLIALWTSPAVSQYSNPQCDLNYDESACITQSYCSWCNGTFMGGATCSFESDSIECASSPVNCGSFVDPMICVNGNIECGWCYGSQGAQCLYGTSFDNPTCSNYGGQWVFGCNDFVDESSCAQSNCGWCSNPPMCMPAVDGMMPESCLSTSSSTPVPWTLVIELTTGGLVALAVIIGVAICVVRRSWRNRYSAHNNHPVMGVPYVPLPEPAPPAPYPPTAGQEVGYVPLRVGPEREQYCPPTNPALSTTQATAAPDAPAEVPRVVDAVLVGLLVNDERDATVTATDGAPTSYGTI